MLLNETRSRLQWISLSLFTILGGIKSIHLSSSTSSSDQVLLGDDDKDQVWGFTLIVFASISSGFTNCYFEKILKTQTTSPTPSLWIRNIQLTIYGSIPNLIFLLYDFYSTSFSGPEPNAVVGVGVSDYFSLASSTQEEGGVGGGLKNFFLFFFFLFSNPPLLWLLVLLQIIGGLLTGTYSSSSSLFLFLSHSLMRGQKRWRIAHFSFLKKKKPLLTCVQI